MEQISQWLVIIILPLTTVVFIAGGIQACRTHGFSFDSNVLFLCAIYNLIFLFVDQIKCSSTGEMFKAVCYTAGILYLFFNFEIILNKLEKDLTALKEKQNTKTQRKESDINQQLSIQNNENSEANEVNDSYQLVNETEAKRPCWRICRRPWFWFSCLILLFILVDSLFQLIIEKSLMSDNHWIAMKVLDLSLAICVYLQSAKMQNLLDEKEKVYLNLGYAKNRLTSPFIQMRRKQLRLISTSFLAANILVIFELIVLFLLTNPAVVKCSKLCAMPETNAAAFYLFFLAIVHLFPTHMFLYGFFLIPRKFYATSDEDLKLSTDMQMLHQPLLEENLNNLDENVNWRNTTPTRAMNKERENSSSSNNLLRTLPSNDASPDSKNSLRISNRLQGTKVQAKSSFKGRRKKAATTEN